MQQGARVPRQGLATGDFGAWLTDYLHASYGYRVLFDHGDQARYPNVCAIHGFFGDRVSNANRLTELDIVVAGPDNQVVLVLEIEEKTGTPKKILGDVLALLLCSGVVAGKREDGSVLRFVPETRFIVAGVAPARGNRLEKIKNVIQPRLHQLGTVPASMNPENIELVFEEQMGQVIERLKRRVQELFPYNCMQSANQAL